MEELLWVTLVYGGYTGIDNQLQKLHKSSKSIIENKERFLMADSQSKKVLKKNNLRSGIELSVHSKLPLFLSLQMHHIKQCKNFLLSCKHRKKKEVSTVDIHNNVSIQSLSLIYVWWRNILIVKDDTVPWFIW